MTPRVLACALILFTSSVLTSSAGTMSAQDLRQVRELYESAAYEDALKALESASATPTEIEKFRALCLLALGRDDEAVSAVERLVASDPAFLPASAEISPKIQAFFSEVRNRLLPDIVKASYAAAKTAYEAADRAAAHAGFQRTIALIETLPEAVRGPLNDLRMLAGEFLELSAVRRAPAVEPVKPLEPPKVEPPIAYAEAAPIREALPAWNPPDATAARTEYVGVLRVFIGADGRVESARMIEPSHPFYDAAALRVAKQWTYKPATRGGQPVMSSRDLRIRLVPQ